MNAAMNKTMHYFWQEESYDAICFGSDSGFWHGCCRNNR
jgi:hypothetical protein